MLGSAFNSMKIFQPMKAFYLFSTSTLTLEELATSLVL